jgi:hypothetical protein
MAKLGPHVRDIVRLAKSDPIDFDTLEAALDSATHHERVAASREFNKKTQRRLWEAAKGRAPSLASFVPVDETHRPIIRWGKNTIFPFVDRFQKRFARVPGREGELVGYNESWYRFAVSPGYYVAYMDEDAGELVVDYTRLPEDRPEQWPRILPNWVGLGPFIFLGMTDRMRRVSDHVTIGRAYKKKPMNAWFVLVREP